jgi:hypothetical protein
VPRHPEFDGVFFNFNLEIRDVAGYEWATSGVPVEEAIRRGVVERRREWDSLLPAVLFTDESDHIRHIPAADWEIILAGVTEALKPYQAKTVTLDYLCQYMRALKTSRIAALTYDPATGKGTAIFEGKADLPTIFFLFEEDAERISQCQIDSPVFTGKIVASFQNQRSR